MVKKLVLAMAALLVIAVAFASVYRMDVGAEVFKQAAMHTVGRDTAAALPEGLHVGLCGTGSPMPNAERAGPCNIVVAGQQIFVVDVGEGANRNIALMGFDAADVSAVFLTHFHSDHIDGLGPLMLFHWTRGGEQSAAADLWSNRRRGGARWL